MANREATEAVIANLREIEAANRFQPIGNVAGNSADIIASQLKEIEKLSLIVKNNRVF